MTTNSHADPSSPTPSSASEPLTGLQPPLLSLPAASTAPYSASPSSTARPLAMSQQFHPRVQQLQIAVLPHARIKGRDTLEGESTTFKTYELCKALTGDWNVDAHLLLYIVPGWQQMPRLKKAALSATRQGGADAIEVPILVFDYDNVAPEGGKRPWVDQEEKAAFLDRLGLVAAELTIPWLAMYTTRNGARLVLALTKNVKPEDAECLMVGVADAFKGKGIVFDPACKDWTRLFRLAFVRRDGKPTKPECILRINENVDDQVVDPDRLARGKTSLKKLEMVHRQNDAVRIAAETANLFAGAGDDFSAEVPSEIQRHLDKVAKARRGQRNTALNQAAFAIGQWLAAGGNSTPDVAARLLRTASDSISDRGDTPEQVDTTIRSGLEAGMAQPRHPSEDRDHTEIQLADKTPKTLALAFLQAETLLHLARWQEGFYTFDGCCYKAISDEAMENKIRRFLDRCVLSNGKDVIANMKLVMEVKAALPAYDISVEGEALPIWRGAHLDMDPRDLVSMRNCVHHLPSGRLVYESHTLFALDAADFDYRPDAAAPARWLAFLQQLFAHDPDGILLLQEWFGYCLTHDNSLQKMMFVCGPKRSGKGTIAQVQAALLGYRSVVWPGFASFSQNFGLAPLIGKRLAIVGDARVGTRADQSIALARLLGITGGDHQSVDRKHKEHWAGALTCRIMILSNELPAMSDSSGAFASRNLILSLKKSFYGQEDMGLADRLKEELPGIYLWSLEGWKRLRRQGRFTEPESCGIVQQELEELGSPVTAFIHDECTVGPDAWCYVEAIYMAWKLWCEAEGSMNPGSKAKFGRDLKAALPEVYRTDLKDGRSHRPTIYRGISLRGGPSYAAGSALSTDGTTLQA